MKKVASLQEYEDSNSEIWKARLEENLKFAKEKTDYFAEKNKINLSHVSHKPVNDGLVSFLLHIIYNLLNK